MSLLRALLRQRIFVTVCLVCLVAMVGVLFSRNTTTLDIQLLQEQFAVQEKYGANAEKWILIDATDTSHASQYVEVPGWRILVFEDPGMNKIRCSNCMHYRILSCTKLEKIFPSFSNIERIKVEGVLYAISSGAKWIFWTSVIDNLQEEVKRFKMASRQTGLVYREHGIMNPASHFTRNLGLTKEMTSLYKLSSWSVPSIQKVWQPDTFEKLSRKMVDYYSPPVLITRPTYLSESFTDTLFHRNMSWCLAPLFNVPQDRVYIWSLWMQRLLWEFDGTIQLLTPWRHLENIRNTIILRHQELILNALCTKLSSWKCDIKNSFYICVIELANTMKEWKYFTQNDVIVIKNWMSLLETNEPVRSVGINVSSNIPIGGLRVAYNPGGNILVGTNENERKDNKFQIQNPFHSVCEMANQTGQPKVFEMMSKPSPFDNIMLVIIFNTPGHLNNIKYLNYMYGRHFAHIVMCGDSLDEFLSYKQTKNSVTFIEVELNFGFFGYQCMMEAMKVGYDVQGYLQISDDVLFNVWNTLDLPQSQPWFQDTIRLGSLSDVRVISYEKKPDPKHPLYWSGWAITEGRKSLLKLWKHFSVLLKDENMDPTIKTFLNVLNNNCGNNNSAFYEASDIFYIPALFKQSYVTMSALFLKYTVHLEIGVPTIISGLVSQKDVVRMSGSYLWEGHRRKYEQYFNSSHMFLHAFKFDKDFRNQIGTKFICKTYLPKIDNHLKEIGLK